ncbi:MAG: hypothetical protein L6428_08000 [Candidatus Aminicenantes bacterium]|nr:hypothetical protein [Candidatus Aminicenantes bacterium]
MLFIYTGQALKIQLQIKFLLAVAFVNVRKIPKVAVIVVIRKFKSKTEIAGKFDCNPGFEYADDLVSSRSDIGMKPVKVIDRSHLSNFRKIKSVLKLGFNATGIIIIPAMYPGLLNINIWRIACAERDEPEMESRLKIGVPGKLPLGNDSSTEAQDTDFENLVLPVVIMLKCPDQHIQIPGVNGLAEYKTIAEEIVQIFIFQIFSVTEFHPQLEEIKRLSGSYFKRISIIQMHLENCTAAARSEFCSLIEPMRSGSQRNIERFFLIDLFRSAPGQLSLQKPAGSSPGIKNRSRKFPEKSLRPGRSIIQDIRT